ncbi:MAG: hypothetical protein IJM47_05505 [Synergistaceae bacterium]|nr:hypothetical protein [Synergistaceae bacterium]
MKKIILTAMLIFIMKGMCFGAVSDDVYIQNINANTERLFTEAKEIRQTQDKQGNAITILSVRVGGLDTRIGDFRNLALILLGILLVMIAIQNMLLLQIENKPSITLEDVQRLIERNNAELLKSLKV